MEVSGVFSRSAFSKGSIAVARLCATLYDRRSSVTNHQHIAQLITNCESRIPGYVDSSFSSFLSRCLISGLNSAGAGASPSSFDLSSACSLSAFAPLARDLSPSSPFGADVLPPSMSSFSGGGGGAGVPERLGSSLSSMTKAASKTAGSGFGAAESVISADGFFCRGRRPAGLASLLRDDVDPDLEGVALSTAFWRACSSAMVRSMAPLILCAEEDVS